MAPARHSHPDDAPQELWLTGINGHVIGYTTGLQPQERPDLPGYNSGVLCLVTATLLLTVFNVRHYGRFFGSLIQNLWSVRSRSNLFDEHTVNETRIIGTLIIQACVCEALLGVFLIIGLGYTTASLTDLTILMLILSGGYYLARRIMYSIVGYAFTTRNLRRQWIEGFNAAHALTGLVMLIPTLILLFYPGAVAPLLTISAIVYILARIVFICKGFRIFYDKIFSFLYFILYLCAVEIIPLILLYKGVVSICCNYQS